MFWRPREVTVVNGSVLEVDVIVVEGKLEAPGMMGYG